MIKVDLQALSQVELICGSIFARELTSPFHIQMKTFSEMESIINCNRNVSNEVLRRKVGAKKKNRFLLFHAAQLLVAIWQRLNSG